MTKGWWAIVLVVVLMGCSLFQDGGTNPRSSSSQSPQPQASVPVVQTPQLVAPSNPPTVNQEQLVAHLQALAGERYTKADRDRTRTYLANTLKDNGWAVTVEAFQSGANVVARPPGKPVANGTVLVVAHFDTVAGSPGVDDNATGVAVALEVSRLLRTRTSNYDLAIALFDREEQGLLGSLAFTAKPANLKHLIGVINLEMLGYTCRTPGCQTYPEGLPIQPPSDRGDFLGIVGDQEHNYLLQAFQLARTENLPPIVTIPIPFKGVLTPDVLRSDHAPFWARNIGAVMVSDTANFRNPNYHQPSDTLDTIDLTFLTQATQLVVNATLVLLGG
ncbi:MAG: M28 family peptidase [Leptolyngbyaceae cyanobacterium bins.302]|nr:M28 family peptidase [Leptolyngbyaceae cyanobacterium bins.302]